MSLQSLVAEAQQLPPQEQVQLIQALLAHLPLDAQAQPRQSLRVFRGQATPDPEDAQRRVDAVRADWSDDRG